MEVSEKNMGNGEMFGWVGDTEGRGPLGSSLPGQEAERRKETWSSFGERICC